MTDEPGDIVRVRKRGFGRSSDAGRVGTIRKVRGKWAKVDFSNYDSQTPRERIYNRKELESVQEARDMPSHIRRAEKEP
jgi:hypothetical protein